MTDPFIERSTACDLVPAQRTTLEIPFIISIPYDAIWPAIHDFTPTSGASLAEKAGTWNRISFADEFRPTAGALQFLSLCFRKETVVSGGSGVQATCTLEIISGAGSAISEDAA